MTVTGFLHPGAMGASVAAACGGRRLWCSHGRSPATTTRAEAAGLEDAGTLGAMVEDADVIVSICPPAAALDQARAVAAAGFTGVYVDANAVAPDTAREIASLFDRPVDGGIIGPPVRAGATRLYLSGDDAAMVAERWSGSDLEVRLVDGGPGAASAVKMAFAAWTKGTSALLLSIRALAESEHITADIVGEWNTSMPDLVARADLTAAGVGPKAWRFAGEMEEIAATFAANGLPTGFHLAAADTYRRLAGFKDRHPGPTLDEAIAALLASGRGD